MGSVRLLPLLAIAALCLFALKAAGLLTNGGYMLSGAPSASAQAADGEAERSPGEGKDSGGGDAARRDASARDVPQKGGESPEQRQAPAGVKGEMDVLTSLAERRETLDERARRLDHRENLLKAAEKRVEKRIEKLKEINQDIESKLDKQKAEREAEFAKMAALYENMKPKEAARVFNRLDIEVLTGLMKRMKTRTLSPVLAEMDPAVVKRVTMEITGDSGEAGRSGKGSLPKIAGEPLE